MRHATSRFTRARTALAASLALALAGCGGAATQGIPAPAVPVPLGVDTANPAPVAVQTQTVSLGTPVALAAKLRTPASGGSHVGIVVMHPYSSYVDFQGCNDLAARGFTTLCVDSSFTNNQYGYYGYEQHVPAIRAGVQYLRNLAGITKVLLFGHSMGAPMMSFYENVAENGPSSCTGPEKFIPCVTTNLQGLPQADGVILFDSHLGDALATFTYVDPAVQNNTLGQRDPSLDMFSSANGYNAATNGAVYSPSFIQTFLTAQAARNATVNASALALLQQSRTSTGDATRLGDDLPFSVVGATSARLWQPDLDLLKCTQFPETLLSHDGTRPFQVVCSVRPPSGAGATAVTAAATVNVNVHVWLGAHAMRTQGTYNQTNNDITGVDYASTATSSVSNLTGVTKPLLIVANSGHYFIRPDEIIYQLARSSDKTYAIEEGAVHGGTECTACEQQLGLPTPKNGAFGYYGDTFGRTMDFMGQWIRKRY